MVRLLKALIDERRGYATLSLALIGLMFTAMLVVPFLTYTQTSLLAVRKASQGLTSASCAATGAEYGLWRLQYDQPFVDSLTLGVPSTFDVSCDSDVVPVTIVLRSVPSPIPQYLAEYAYADIVLVMDVSTSIDANEMAVFQDAAHAIADGFNLDQNGDRYRIGLSRFSGNSEPVVDMTDQASTVHAGIDTVDDNRLPVWNWGCFCLIYPPVGSGTNLVAGMNGGAAQYATGLGDRAEIPNLMVFLTDGNDNAGNTLLDIQNAAAATGARIFAVGIDQVYIDTLNAIASEPDADHVFYASNFQGLLDLIDDIVSAVTLAGLAGTLYDIDVIGPDGVTIRMRALVTVEGTVVVISSQEV